MLIIPPFYRLFFKYRTKILSLKYYLYSRLSILHQYPFRKALSTLDFKLFQLKHIRIDIRFMLELNQLVDDFIAFVGQTQT